MLSLFTTIISFASGGLPKILDYFKDRSDKSHELALAQLQMNQQLELQKLGFVAQKDLEEVKFEELKEQTASTDFTAAIASDSIAGQGASQWAINIRALVRPAITFGLFAIFLGIEIWACFYAYRMHVGFEPAIKLLWTDETQTIWASIVGFYFGCRHFQK